MDTMSIVKLLIEDKNLKATNNKKIGENIKGESIGTTIGSNRIGWHVGKLCWLYPDNTYYNSFSISDSTLDMEWELIKNPVDFMTAINSGKYFKPESWIYQTDNKFRNLYDNLEMFSGRDVAQREIINGKWYIKETIII